MKNKNIISGHQHSLTEWFKYINSGDSKRIQEEDNEKHTRLGFLKKFIRLPYEETERVEAIDLFNKTPRITKIFEKKGEKLCAIRLVPKKQDLPKLRNRGMTLNECYGSWFLKQKIDFKEYYAEICPHNEVAVWSMIIIANKEGIFGEVISGHGFQLMHGETMSNLYFFQYDFKKWKWSKENKEVVDYVKQAIEKLKIKTPEQEKIIKESKGKIHSGYLAGYFEVVVLLDKKVYFNDYSRVLPDYIKTPSFDCIIDKSLEITGFVAYPGKVVGKIQKITEQDIAKTKFKKGSILVTENTDIRYLPFMRKAGAIITERGSILSHASIVAREFKIPCVVNVKNATKILKDGSAVKVDANKGIITILDY
ncbi:MAG: hypothetical protein ACD_7C00024G0005 [uncultured bacterium]|nr:MAG: hypothetical protein ACD_7C00024G0005 [uncultured bacterium]